MLIPLCRNESSLAVSPRQHAPSPMEYTKPVSSMAAPTPVHPSRDDGTHITHHHTVPGGERDGGDTTRSDRSDSGSDDGASDSDSRDCDSSVHNSDESPKDVVSSGSEDGFSLQQLQPSVPPPLNVEGTGSTTSGGEEAQVCQNLAVSSASLKDSDHFLQLKHMIGIDPSLRHNLVWHPLLGGWVWVWVWHPLLGVCVGVWHPLLGVCREVWHPLLCVWGVWHPLLGVWGVASIVRCVSGCVASIFRCVWGGGVASIVGCVGRGVASIVGCVGRGVASLFGVWFHV